MFKATEEVREYFEWQAPDLEVTFMQKVYSEAILNTRHDVWDIHTNKDRWWVIAGGTNLYSQEQFPNAWTEIICNDLLPGDTNKERRGGPQRCA
ncbi:hypothetical protein NKH81_14320 [Mesorhizobium sp. M0959]|uniref:hypothetical protein n=1 Tax=Mesorhizobium sp. M0959 TaxID=2957034 RepID=UPI0033399B0A